MAKKIPNHEVYEKFESQGFAIHYVAEMEYFAIRHGEMAWQLLSNNGKVSMKEIRQIIGATK